MLRASSPQAEPGSSASPQNAIVLRSRAVQGLSNKVHTPLSLSGPETLFRASDRLGNFCRNVVETSEVPKAEGKWKSPAAMLLSYTAAWVPRRIPHGSSHQPLPGVFMSPTALAEAGGGRLRGEQTASKPQTHPV